MKDRPDVRLTTPDGHRIGIELARVYIQDGRRGSYSEQSQAPLRAKVLAAARDAYIGLGGRPVLVGIDFSTEPDQAIKKPAEVSLRLAAAVHALPPGEFRSRDPFKDVPEVRFAYVQSSDEHPTEWDSLQLFFVPPLQVQRVREELSKKVGALAKYDPCDEYWLVLTIGFWDPAQDQGGEWPTAELVDYGGFSRVFLHHTHHYLVELPRLP